MILAIINMKNKALQQIKEKLLNEKENLEREERELSILNLNVENADDRKKAVRLGVVRDRIKYLNQLLINKNS